MGAPVILNLGCGNRTSPAAVNIDWSIYLRLHSSLGGRLVARRILSGQRLEQFDSLDGNIVVHDLRKGIPAENNSADAVYHSHTLEHIDRAAVPDFMAEVLRALRPGGIHRVVVPNLERMVSEYQESLAAGSPDHDSQYVDALFEQSVRREASGTSHQPPLRRRVENLLLGDARKRGETHQWQWDRLNLARTLEQAGFAETHHVDAHTSNIPGWVASGLDTNPDGTVYRPGSLYMEARKPL